MKIEIWSDFACPYCYIGEKKLEKAMEEMNISNDIDINFRSFQLNVDAVSHPGVDLNTLIANKYGISYEQAQQANEGIIATAKEVGLNYDFDNIKPGNTRLAHELYKYAASVGKGPNMVDTLFASYFEKGIDISSESTLINLAVSIGLDEMEIKKIISEGIYSEEVKKDQKIAHENGINSVPFFVIDNKYAVSGAQSIEYFKAALDKAMEE